jgi:hypothetical protein
MSELGLQLAPSAFVTEEMRRTVLQAMSDSGIAVGGWVPLQGEAIPAEWPGPVAQPSFSLIVAGSVDRTPEELVLELGSRLGDALARIRFVLPSLPVSINTVSDDRRRWFSFRPAASPESMRQGVAALPAVLTSEHDALGWDDVLSEWVVL